MPPTRPVEAHDGCYNWTGSVASRNLPKAGIQASRHKAARSIRNGSLCSRAVGWNERSPTFPRLGDYQEAAAPFPVGRSESTPTFSGWGIRLRFHTVFKPVTYAVARLL